MGPNYFTRRKFAGRLAGIAAGLGFTGTGANAFAAPGRKEVRKLNYEGNPASGKQMITPLIVHQGLIYISGQGANDAGAVQNNNIEAHTQKVMNNVKTLVEHGGGSMESILQMTVYLASLDDYKGMNEVFKTYFPNGGPARTTIAVAGVPGHSLLEVNCIAAVVK